MANQDNYEYPATGEAYDQAQEQQAYDLSQMDPEQRAQLEEEWRTELLKTEEEIQTLKQVLASKTKQAQELKRKLGISAWKEWTSDLGQGVKNLQETTAYKDVSDKFTEWNSAIHSAPIYQKTSDAVKGVGEKTTSLFGGVGGSLMSKLGAVKDSTAFKSFEEKVGTAVGTVKNKMAGSRSNSTNSFEEALNSMEQQRAAQQGTATATPVIPENAST
ncbi:Tumor protein D54 [Halotydeus destructor]|nr:Tumor protein D54 [Halotydeus destructor]